MVALGIEHGSRASVAKNSDHQTTEEVTLRFTQPIEWLSSSFYRFNPGESIDFHSKRSVNGLYNIMDHAKKRKVDTTFGRGAVAVARVCSLIDQGNC
jgi:hypothetical protein